MQTQNRFFDDLAGLLGGAAGALLGIRNEMENVFRQQLERLLASMDLVSYDAFDALHALAQATRTHQENLEQRLAAFESKAATRSVSRSVFRRLPHRRAVASLSQAARRRRRNRRALAEPS